MLVGKLLSNKMTSHQVKMKFIVWAFVFIVVGFCQGATAGKPTMTVTENRESFQEGDELEFKCTGDGGNVAITRMEIHDNEGNESNYTVTTENRTVTWHTSKAKHGDTGWYSCAYVNTSVINNERIENRTGENIDWKYVFVNSTRKFAVEINTFKSIIAQAGARVIVPCRVTSLNLTDEVKLYIGTTLQNFTYEPRIGFIIPEFKTEWHYDKNKKRPKVRCEIKNTSNETNNSADNQTYRFKKPRKLGIPPTVNLDNIFLENSLVGNNLTLNCNINTSWGKVSYLNWTVLSANGIHEVEGKNKKCETAASSCENNWTLSNLKKEDSGRYKCTAYDSADATNQKSKEITINIRDKPYLYCKPEEQEEIKGLSDNTPAHWVRFIESSEKPTFKWYKLGSEVNLLSGNDGKYTIDQNHHDKKRKFVISNASVTDTGNYKMLVKISNDSCEYRLRLVVDGKPKVVVKSLSMAESLTHHKPGISATFTCTATASPIPNITWIFTKWPPETADPEILYPTENPSKNLTLFFVESQLTMTIDKIGFLTCEACNNDKNNNKRCTTGTQSILISDRNGTIGISGPDIVTEHDDLTLECFATRLNYTEPLTWYKTDGNGTENIIESTRGRTINQSETSWTIISELRIQNVRKNDSGSYRCQARNKSSTASNSTRNITFEVHEESPLSFAEETTLNNTIVLVDAKHSGDHRPLKCVVVGMPPPTVFWYKNGDRSEQLLTNYPYENDDGKYRVSIDNSTLEIYHITRTANLNFSCVANNRRERIERYTYFNVDGKSMTSSTLILLISFICVLIVVIIAVITYAGIKVHRERKLRRELLDAGLTHFVDGALECLNPELTVDDQAELLPYDTKWEFPRENLKIGKQLGSGAFGVVVKAEARGICVEGEVTTVAVKMVRRTAEPSYMKALSSELKIMIHLGKHLNVVNLLGACTKTILTKRELYVIVEYCRFGNLHNYLQRQRSSFIHQVDPATDKIDFSIGEDRFSKSISIQSQNRSNPVNSNSSTDQADYRRGTDFEEVDMSPDNAVLNDNSVQPGWRSNYRGDYNDQNSGPISTQDLLCWAWQVSRGMEYLSSRNVLHGDLAARNILLAEDNIIKICDFGLAKNMYKDTNYKKKGDTPLPIKWMAVESIRDRIFSTHSDVWSFGIVLWEFFTLARTPYPGMEAEKQYDRLIEGYRMEKPEYATDEIYDLMLRCWKGKPSLRPTFSELAQRLGALLEDSLRLRFTALDTLYLNMNSDASANGQRDYLIMMSAPNHDHCYASNRALEAVPGYIPMNLNVNINDPGVFSPRPDCRETQFRFYPPAENVSDSNSQNRIETEAMVERDPESGDGRDSPDSDVQTSENETSSNDISITKNMKNKDGFPTTTGHQNYVNMPKTGSETEDLSRTISIEPEDLTPPIIRHANYTNIPKKNSDPLVDGISSPNYTIISVVNEIK